MRTRALDCTAWTEDLLQRHTARRSCCAKLLFCSEIISPEFARDVILPAVRANSSLQKLSFGHDMPLLELTEAHAIVAARTQRMPLPLPPPDLL